MIAKINKRINGAYTLIELLVVMAILAVLAGMTLAAVQKARAAAAKTDCQNRLRQIGLALLQRHDSGNNYPPGHRTLTNRDLMPFSGWTFDSLPYLEQTPVQDRARRDYQRQLIPFDRMPPAVPHDGLSTVITAYICPSDLRVRTAQVTKVTQTLVAFTSFLGVAGQNAKADDGVLYSNSRTSIAMISDGTSNTLLLGERPPSADLQFGWWYAGTGQRARRRGTGDMTLSVREPNLQPIVSGGKCGPGVYPFRAASGFDDPCGMFHFWSPHAGGANFAFADGSVKLLKYSANEIMPALASRAGGESVEVP